MNDELRRRLEEAGQGPVPDPRPEFATELEDRLLVVARSKPPGSPEGEPSGPRLVEPSGRLRPSRRPAFGLAAGLAGLAAMLVGVIIFGSLGAQPASALELTDAVNVEVSLADGTTLVDPVGLLLPEGAVVRVGHGGSARIGEVELGAGDVATVGDRRLRVDRRDDSTTSVEATPRPDGTPGPSPDAAPSTSPRPTAIPPATDRPATPPPDHSEPPGATPPPKTPLPVLTAPPDHSPDVTPRPDVKPIKLEARATGPSEVSVLWSAVPGAAKYVLVASATRNGSAGDPAYPGSPVIGEFTHPPVRPLSFRVGPDVTQLRLLVVALSPDGALVGKSEIVTVVLPG